MFSRKPVRRLLRIVNIGFASIIGVSWLDELVDLPHIVFGGTVAPSPNWREGIIETLIVILAWGVVALIVGRLAKRLYYLEGFLRVCAWCRKIHHDGRWIPIEEYFRKRFAGDTTHGMCPACAEAQCREIGESRERGGG